MRKKKLPKKIRQRRHSHSFFWLFVLIGLAMVGGVVSSVNRTPVTPERTSSYESIDSDKHEGYEEPANSEYKEAVITIKDGKFIPETLEVDSETLIIFENEENTSHVVVSDNAGKEEEISFDTQELPYGTKVPTVEYGIPGTYHYHDKLNPQMKGTIVVKDNNG